MINVGLIGYGYWGKIIHSKLKLISDVKFICRSKDTYVDKLDSVDWVFVVTPDNTHYEITKTCLEHGKNVFCEKPFTDDLQKAIELYDLADKNNVKLYVDDVFNYRSEIKELQNSIDKKKDIKVIWNTLKSKNYLNRLTWHDLYILHPILDGELKVEWPKINNITFNYDVSDKKYHEVDGINLTHNHGSNDALFDMIDELLYDTDSINFQYNKDVTIQCERILKMIKDNIND